MALNGTTAPERDTLPLRAIGFRMRREDLGDDRLQLGTADFQYGDIRLIGCALVTARNGGLTILSPAPAKVERSRAVEFWSSDLRLEMVRMALAAYIAMAGSEFDQSGERIIGTVGGQE